METLMQLLMITTSPLASATASRKFDYFQFVQQYPKTLCMNNGVCPPGITLPTDFYIHGLWPTNYSAPHDPCVGKLFDYNMLLQVRQTADLTASWPSFTYRSNDSFTYRSNDGFWEHEWNHHGTCSELLLPQADYFQLAVSLRNYQMKLFQLLWDNGIRPGNYYPANVIISALHGAKPGPGTLPSVMCRKDASGQEYLHEIIFCIDSLISAFINCPRPSTCRGLVGYPL